MSQNIAVPLADRIRPNRFEDFIGQAQVTEVQNSVLELVKKGYLLPNLILWGPPGTGKTTFARILAEQSRSRVLMVNAIDTGAKALREIGKEAHQRKLQFDETTILFIDEIHRLNRGQQDVLLPFTEKGDLSLIGATTENPSYELNAALLSRARVLRFEPFNQSDLKTILKRAAKLAEIKLESLLTEEAIDSLCELSEGDARKLINNFERLVQVEKPAAPIQAKDLLEYIERTGIGYDKQGEEHYNVISAFIKSIRGSDPDAGIYYLARMLEAGEDPKFIARRLVILASEDIGNADPRALQVAVSGAQALEFVGLPEAAINLAQVVTYLASAPKSNRSYLAIKEAQNEVRKTGALPVPLALRSSQTKLSKQFGYGKGYKYSHEGAQGYLPQKFLPDRLKDRVFYEPVDRGFEKNIREYQSWVKRELKLKKKNPSTEGASD